MQDDVKAAGIAHLPDATDRLRRCLSKLAETVQIDRGATLFVQGDPGDALYTLEMGLMEVSVVSQDGQKLTLNALCPGDTFGEIALFDFGPRTATVTALEASTLARVDRAALTRAARADPDIALDLIDLAGRRLRWYGAALRDLAFHPLSVRLARRLLYLHGRLADGGNTLRLTQAELAEHVGNSREAVSKVLKGWRKARIIDLGRGQVRILKIDALAQIAAREAE